MEVSIVATSASGLYPSFSMRSASSFAFFSAASKSIASPAPSLFAPSFCGFFVPKTFALRGAAPVVLRIAAEEIARDVVVCDELASEFVSGDFGLPLPLVSGFRKGEAVRLIMGGV